MNKAFSRNMISYRLEFGWTQEQAAKAIGIKRSRLGAYEEGRSFPQCDILIKIVKAYKINDLLQFITGESYTILNEESSDIKIVRKYHSLNEKDRKVVDFLFDII